MGSSLYIVDELAFVSPFLAIAAVLVHYCLRRFRWKRQKNRSKLSPPFYSSSAGLGTILLFMQMFYRPSIAHVVEVREQMDADDDDTGEPEAAGRQLNRQLRKIRRGETIDELVLRL